MRQLKNMGSNKSDTTCVAHIKAIENMSTGAVTVEYCAAHNSHNIEICHLPISHDTKAMIASKLQDGVCVDRILDDVRDSFSYPGYRREHIVTKKDITNIKQKLNLQCIQKHSNDLISVCTWVEELRSYPYNSVVLFKPQGHVNYPDYSGSLAKDTFLLGIQTEYQCDAMQHHGNKLICMDSTHGTNLYDFLLISVMVVDEYGEGLPVAWAISNHEDTAVLVEFLQGLKTRTGEVHPDVFMSDDAQQFYNAWNTVYGATPAKLLCMWHVDRSWRKSLSEHVEGSQCRIEIYHFLRGILVEQNKTEFTLKLQKFMSYLHDNFFQYYEYFKRTYAGRCEQWAACFRIGCVVNTNMFTESFHRLLKVVYLEGKQNRRVDTLLHTLLRIARNLIFEQLTKEEKGKLSHRKCEVTKRHKTAVELIDVCTVTHEEETVWKVQSQSNKNTEYTINQLSKTCSCKLGCSHCGACFHMYNCSCIDYALHSTVCKHIHLVQMHIATASTDNQSHNTFVKRANEDISSGLATFTPLNQDEDAAPFNTSEYFSVMLQKEQRPRSLENMKVEIYNLMHKIKGGIDECHSLENLEIIKKHLQSAVSSIEVYKHSHHAKDDQSFTQKINPPSNACNKKQFRFFSTKRKRTSSARMQKPSIEEHKKATEKLQSVEVTVCCICWKEDDSSTSEDVLWIACRKCGLWMHSLCVEQTDSEEYLCKNCSFSVTECSI